MEASRRQPGMLEGLSRFLIQHERCGAGFDVAHPAGLGSGRVSITCRGCGARHEYATATIEFERELKIEPMDPLRAPPPPRQAPPPREPIPPPPRRTPIPPRPGPYPGSTSRPATPAREEAATAHTPRPGAGGPAAAAARGASAVPGAARPRVTPPRRESAATVALRRFWRSPQATIVLFVVAAVALGFAVVRLVNGGGGSENQSSAPAPAQAPTTTPAPSAAPTPVPGPAAKPTPSPRPPGTTLRTQRFTIEVPRGWTERTSTGGLLLQPRGDRTVNVQIFFQRSPGLTLSRMAQQTTAFLRREVPGASLFPRQVRIAASPARELMARGPGETAIAVDVLHGPYRYLLVRRIFAGAKPQTSAATGRVVSSFRPR